MKILSLSDKLATYFLVNNYEWKFDYGMANPDASDIEAVIKKAKQILDGDKEISQLEVGRLLFKKESGGIDVYVYTGRIGEDEI
jgi:hypothetical protein